jgi:hypothetical protein
MERGGQQRSWRGCGRFWSAKVDARRMGARGRPVAGRIRSRPRRLPPLATVVVPSTRRSVDRPLAGTRWCARPRRRVAPHTTLPIVAGTGTSGPRRSGCPECVVPHLAHPPWGAEGSVRRGVVHERDAPVRDPQRSQPRPTRPATASPARSGITRAPSRVPPACPLRTEVDTGKRRGPPFPAGLSVRPVLVLRLLEVAAVVDRAGVLLADEVEVEGVPVDGVSQHRTGGVEGVERVAARARQRWS